MSLHSTFALITAPVEESSLQGRWSDRCMVWDSGNPYRYLRAVDGNRVMVGGEDVRFKNAALRDRLLPAKTARLESHLNTMFPGVPFETEYAWAGTFGETRDGLPCIGPRADLPRALFALGYGGNGIVFSMLASRILRNIILGEGDEDAELFSLDRHS